MTQPAVVVVQKEDGWYVYGPFTDGQEATRWGFENMKNDEVWGWEPLVSSHKKRKTGTLKTATDWVGRKS